MSWAEGEKVVLESERLLLRSLTPKDVDDHYIQWWNDARIQNPMNELPRHASKNSLISFVSQFDNRLKFHLGIFRKLDSGEHLLGFITIFTDPKTSVGTVNIVIGDKKFWGSAIPNEALRMALDFAFGSLKLFKVCSEIASCNRASLAMSKRLYGRSEGILRGHRPGVDGGRIDIHQFGMFKEEWNALRVADPFKRFATDGES